MIAKGTWVSVRRTILESTARAQGIPEDTASTSLIMWVKGFLEEDGEVGEEVSIRTRMNRREEGILEEVNPVTRVDYGEYVPEIIQIGMKARSLLEDGGEQGD